MSKFKKFVSNTKQTFATRIQAKTISPDQCSTAIYQDLFEIFAELHDILSKK